MDSKGKDFVLDQATRLGIIRQKLDTTWVSTESGFKIQIPPQFSVCNRKSDDTQCDTGWIDKKVLTKRVRHAVAVPELEQKCTELNKVRDHAFSYRVDCVMSYLCVKQQDPETHLTGRDVVYSMELGLSGIIPSTLFAILNIACGELEEERQMRMHSIFSIELQLIKGGVAVGGCPELINVYRVSCHPSVCVCNGDRQPGNLCQHWFMDSLLGADLDIKTAHPSVVTACGASGKVTNFKSLFHTAVRLTDDTVYGGLLSRLGLLLFLLTDTTASSPLGVTTLENHSIEIIINMAKCTTPKLLGEVVLHECAHVRVLADMPFYNMGEPEPHGEEWLLRMNDIRRLLAYRLTYNSHALCRKRRSC
jgi:predicted SprT family Zn-dependent metalloprotease